MVSLAAKSNPSCEVRGKIRVRPAEEGGKIPTIALTAYGRARDHMLSLTAGYSMHVPKPVDPVELVRIIESICGRLTG